MRASVGDKIITTKPATGDFSFEQFPPGCKGAIKEAYTQPEEYVCMVAKPGDTPTGWTYGVVTLRPGQFKVTQRSRGGGGQQRFPGGQGGGPQPRL